MRKRMPESMLTWQTNKGEGRLTLVLNCHSKAVPGIPNQVPVAGFCEISAAVGNVKWNVTPRPMFAVACGHRFVRCC
jgi:hypothetical protein